MLQLHFAINFHLSMFLSWIHTLINKTRHLTTKKHTSPWRIREKNCLPDRKEPTEPGIEAARGPHVKANIGQPPENRGLVWSSKEHCSTRIIYLYKQQKSTMYQPTSMTFCSGAFCWRGKNLKTWRKRKRRPPIRSYRELPGIFHGELVWPGKRE